MKTTFILILSIIFTMCSTPLLADNTVIKPAALKPGDTVGLIASAFSVDEDVNIQYAIERMHALGLNVKLGKAIYAHHGYFAGTDLERAADINNMFADKTVKAIIELRGDWGTDRLLHLLDYEQIKKHPKIIMGYSDITSLLLAIYAKTGLITFHGPLAASAWPKFTVDYVKKILFNDQVTVLQNPILPPTNDLIQTQYRIQTISGGKARGQLLGGNLTVLTSMLGSNFLPKWNNSILFIEDVGEDIYRIDRLLTQLKLAGVLDQIKGFIFGVCTGCNPSRSTSYHSFTLMQVLKHHIEPLHIPAWYGAMIGHQAEIFTMPEGIKIEIDADKGTIKMLEPAVK